MAFHARDFGAATKVDRGRMAYHAGLSAEAQVARHYLDRGCTRLAERWRAGGGELDLVFEQGGEIVFVEVKKSRCFDRALTSLSAAQVNRLFLTAEQFLGTQSRVSLTPSRFDVALVNDAGRVKIMENALAAGW